MFAVCWLASALTVQSAQSDSLREQVDTINARLARTAIAADDAKEEIDSLKEQIREQKESILHIEDEKAAEEEYLRDFIVATYESRADRTPFDSFIRSGSLVDYINRQEYVSDVIREFNKRLAEYEDMDALLKQRQEELAEMVSDRKKQKAELKNQQKKFQEALDAANRKLARAEAAELAAELEKMRAREAMALENADLQTIGQSSGWDENRIYDGRDFYTEAVQYAQSDLTLLAGLIQAEAGNQPYEGKLAVGSVVMNRVASNRFPNTIAGVIYSPKQFTPAESGRLALILAQGPNSECIQAAQEVLNGRRNVTNLYFKSLAYAQAHGITGIQIAGQVFH